MLKAVVGTFHLEKALIRPSQVIVKIREVPLTALSEMLHFQPIITERRRGTLEHFFTSVVNLFFIFFVIKSRLLVLNRAVCGLGLCPQRHDG